MCQLLVGRVVSEELLSGIRELKRRVRDCAASQEAAVQHEMLNVAAACRSQIDLPAISLDSDVEDGEAHDGGAFEEPGFTAAASGPPARARRYKVKAGEVKKITFHCVTFSSSFRNGTLHVSASAAAVKVLMRELRALMVPLQVRRARQLGLELIPSSLNVILG